MAQFFVAKVARILLAVDTTGQGGRTSRNSIARRLGTRTTVSGWRNLCSGGISSRDPSTPIPSRARPWREERIRGGLGLRIQIEVDYRPCRLNRDSSDVSTRDIAMETERLTCASCGASLDIPRTDFFTCGYCETTLSIKRSKSGSWTEIHSHIRSIAQNTERSAQNTGRTAQALEVIAKERRIERLRSDVKSAVATLQSIQGELSASRALDKSRELDRRNLNASGCLLIFGVVSLIVVGSLNESLRPFYVLFAIGTAAAFLHFLAKTRGVVSKTPSIQQRIQEAKCVVDQRKKEIAEILATLE